MHRHAAGHQADPAVAHDGQARASGLPAHRRASDHDGDKRESGERAAESLHAPMIARRPAPTPIPDSPACSSNAFRTAPSSNSSWRARRSTRSIPALCNDLRSALADAVAGGAQGIVLSGGPKVFSAGLDVPFLLSLGDDRAALLAAWSAFFDAARALAAIARAGGRRHRRPCARRRLRARAVLRLSRDGRRPVSASASTKRRSAWSHPKASST